MIEETYFVYALPRFDDVSAVRFFSLERFALVDGLRALSLPHRALILVPVFYMTGSVSCNSFS